MCENGGNNECCSDMTTTEWTRHEDQKKQFAQKCNKSLVWLTFSDRPTERLPYRLDGAGEIQQRTSNHTRRISLTASDPTPPPPPRRTAIQTNLTDDRETGSVSIQRPRQIKWQYVFVEKPLWCSNDRIQTLIIHLRAAVAEHWAWNAATAHNKTQENKTIKNKQVTSSASSHFRCHHHATDRHEVQVKASDSKHQRPES